MVAFFLSVDAVAIDADVVVVVDVVIAVVVALYMMLGGR